MAKNEPDENSSKPMSDYAKYSSMGFQMIAVIGLLTYAGLKIDESVHHTTRWVTAIFSLAGVFISLYLVIVSLRK